MSRRYRSESIEVATDEDGEPAGFRWRGRRYAVRVIVATWVEALPWWVDGLGTGLGTDGLRVESSRVDGASGQRQVWRVEAAPRTGTVGVYDLYRTPRGDRQRWGLERVLD
jgi:hypothetical protein